MAQVFQHADAAPLPAGWRVLVSLARTAGAALGLLRTDVRHRITVPPMSEEWLRAHDETSAKRTPE